MEQNGGIILCRIFQPGDHPSFGLCCSAGFGALCLWQVLVWPLEGPPDSSRIPIPGAQPVVHTQIFEQAAFPRKSDLTGKTSSSGRHSFYLGT